MNRLLIPRDLAPGRLMARAGAVVHLQGRTMGTAWSVKTGGGDVPRDVLHAQIQRRLDALDRQMSHWDGASTLCAFNRLDAGQWLELPAEFFTVLSAALALAETSGGACDPTIGALVNLWGFGPGAPRTAPPDAAAIHAARERGGWEKLQLDPATRCARQPGGMLLDLSCIAKGYAVDQVTELLEDLGIPHYLVEVGGELRGAGCKSDGMPWWVELDLDLDLELEPVHDAAPRTMVALHQLAVATSGDSHRHFEHQGVRYAHTLDPRSGHPVPSRIAAVTVLHPSGMQADALATALTVLGPDQGLAFAERHGIAALFRLRGEHGAEERLSRAAAAMLE